MKGNLVVMTVFCDTIQMHVPNDSHFEVLDDKVLLRVRFYRAEFFFEPTLRSDHDTVRQGVWYGH